MLQKLPAAHFGLAVHHDKHELSIYTITLAKGGPKLEKSKSDPDALSDENGHGVGQGQYHEIHQRQHGGLRAVPAVVADAPVVDQTSLAGRNSADGELIKTSRGIGSQVEILKPLWLA